MERIEIYTSKKKSVLALFGSLLFVALCFLIITGILDTNLYKRLVALVGFIFFGFIVYIAIKRLIKKKLVLTIDEIGINVNPEKSDEKIFWENIEAFPIINIKGTKIILIAVNNPQYWIDKETSKIRKKIMEFNYNSYTSPFNLSSNSMEIKHTQLVELLNRHLLRYGKLS